MIGGFHKIPEALRVAIAGETFSESVNTLRKTLVYAESEKAQSLTCYVAPISVLTTPGTRQKQGHEWLTGVYVVEQVSSASETERQAREDTLMTVTDEILEFVSGLKSITVDGADLSIRISDAEPRLPTDFEAYQKSKVFVGSFNVVVIE